MVHELKCWPPYWEEIFTGTKTFDVRKDDRHYRVGDTLTLREWNQSRSHIRGDGCSQVGDYTGRVASVCVVYKLDGGQYGIEPGYCVLGIRVVP